MRLVISSLILCFIENVNDILFLKALKICIRIGSKSKSKIGLKIIIAIYIFEPNKDF